MWVFLISVVYAVCIGELIPILSFLSTHFFFTVHMVSLGVFSMVGQMFVYNMIKHFKQHIVPFVITTRKIFTVGLSIFYFKHATNIIQIIGLFLVFAIVTYEFIT